MIYHVFYSLKHEDTDLRKAIEHRWAHRSLTRAAVAGKVYQGAYRISGGPDVRAANIKEELAPFVHRDERVIVLGDHASTDNAVCGSDNDEGFVFRLTQRGGIKVGRQPWE